MTLVSVPEVEFVSPGYTVAEDVGEVNVCLRIDRIISSPVTVRLHAIPDTAECELSRGNLKYPMLRLFPL